MRKNEKRWMHEMQKSKPGLVGAPGELHPSDAMAETATACCMNLLLIEHFGPVKNFV